MKRLFPVLFVLAFTFSHAQWTQLNGPYGGNISRFKKAPNGTLYAVVNQKLWKSTNNGDLWSEVIPTSPTSLFLNDIMIDSDGKLYAAYWSQLFSSSDNGITWTTVSTNIFQNVQNIDRVGPDNVFVVWGSSGVYVSINKGVAWTQISTLGWSGTPGLWSNTSGDIFYAIQGGGLLKHSYQGLTANWSAANMTQIFTVTPSNVNAMAIDGTGKIYLSSFEKVYTSINNGTSFTDITTTSGLLPTYGYFWGPMAVSPDGSISIFNNGQSKIHKSSNQGASWTTTDLPTTTYGGQVYSSVFASASTYYLGTTEGLLKTTDTGLSWVTKNVGLTGSTSNNIVVANTTGRIIVGRYGRGYWTSTDGGTNWSFNTLTGGNGYISKALKLANGTILLYGSDNIYRSTDNGTTFTTDGIYRAYNFVIIEAANGDLYLPYQLWNGTNYVPKIAKSTDSGATWVDLAITGLPNINYYVNSAAIDGTTNMILHGYDYSAASYKTFKVVGTTATQLTMPFASSLNNVFFQNNKFYASQFSAYYYTSDLGTTWTTVGFSGNRVFPIKNNTYSGIAVSRSGSLYISQDEGGTWSNTTLPSSTAYITDIATDAAGDYYASASGSTVLKFTNELLVDPATLPPYINFNWQPLNGPYGGNVSRIEIHPDGNTLLAVSLSRLWKYSGGSWSKLEPVAVNGTIFDVEIDASGAIYVLPLLSPAQKIYKSVDLGVTWSPLTSTGLPASTSAIRDIEVLSNGSILAFGSFNSLGRIYKSSDNGATFTERHTSAFNVQYGISLRPIVRPSTEVVAIFGLPSEGLVVSTDFGTTWTLKSTSAIADPAKGFVGSYMYDKDGNILLMSIVDNTVPLWDARISKSTDNGSTWTTLPTPTITDASGTFNYSKRIIALGTGEYLMCVQSLFECYRSSDGGATWNSIGNVGDVFIWAATKGTTSYILGSGNAGILKTTDGGLNFTPHSQGIPHPSASEISLSNNKDLLIGATRPYYSGDFGQTFSLATLQPAAKYLQVGDSLIGYGSRLLLKSKDGGKTWSSFGTDRLLTFLTKDATGNGFYGSNGTSLNYSTDLINWTNIVLSGLPTSYSIFGMVIDQGGVIYAVVREFDPVNFNLLSTDVYKIVFGSAIKISSTIGTSNPASIRYFNNKIYLYDTRGIIYKSSDGEIWTQGSAPAGTSMVVASNYLFIPASNSVLWVSRNDGATWQSVGDVPPTSGAIPIFQNIVINEYDGYAYATLSNSVAKKSGNIVMPDDKTKPVATAYSPSNNATSIELKPKLTITFDEITKSVPGKFVRVFDVLTPALPVITIDMSTATQNGKSWSMQVISPLAFNKTYFVVMDAGSVTDIFGNAFNGISSSTVWRFTTKAAPTVSILSPANNENGVFLNKSLEVTFSEPSSGVNGKNISVYKSSAPSVAITTLAANTGVVSGNKLTYTLPAGALEFNTTYFVKADVSGFSTADGGVFSALTGNTDWTFSTRPAPLVTTLSPAHNATNIALTTALGITFSEPMTAVPAKNISIFKVSQPATAVASMLTTTGAISGNTVTFTLANPLEYQTQYFVKLDDGAFKSTEGVALNFLNNNTSWLFTTVEAPDTQKPTITFTTSNLEKGVAKTFEITVNDNKPLPADKTKIYYRKITDLATAPFASADMTAGAGSGTVSSKFTLAAQESWYDAMGLEFYFETEDAAGNKERSPSVATNYHYSYISYTNDNTYPVLNSVLSFGGNQNNYRIVTIPYKLTSATISDILNEAGAIDKTKWRVFTLGSNNSYSEPTTFTHGKGYWINIRNNPTSTVKIEGSSTPEFNKSNFFSMPLNVGWNMIGNPYPVDISWEETRSGVTGVGKVKVFNGTSYEDVNDLKPMQGGFVNVTGSAANLKVRFKGITSGGRIMQDELGTDLAESNWMIPIKAVNNDITNALGGVGMHKDAKSGWDEFDNINPPRFLDAAELAFVKELADVKKLARDVVPTQEEYVWDMNVETADGITILQWDNESIISHGKELMLFDVNRQKIVDMKAEGYYGFEGKAGSAFKIYFGTNLRSKIKPTQIILSKPFPNPMTTETMVSFTLPEKQKAYLTQLEVYNATGQRVTTLADGNFESGFYSTTWSPIDIKSGLYLFRLTVLEEGTQKVITEKVVLNR